LHGKHATTGFLDIFLIIEKKRKGKTMKSKYALILAIGALLSVAAYAEDRWPVPWDPALPNQTYQAWEFPMMNPQLPLEPYPTHSNNPFGQPGITETPPVSWEWIQGPEGPAIIQTLHIDQSGPFTIWVPNNPNPNDVKYVFWQITSDKSPTPTGTGPSATTPEGFTGSNLPSPYPQIQHTNDNWYSYNGLIAIRPNPIGEWITWNLVESTNIEEIVIKTVCMPIPEPMTIGLLGIGLVALVLKKRS
jgi:hypothetical protein